MGGSFGDFSFLVRYVLALLAIWRLTHAFAYETGPFAWFVNFREWVNNRWGFDSWQAEFARCPLCQSMWVGLLLEPVFFQGLALGDFVLVWVSLSGGVTLLQLMIAR